MQRRIAAIGILVVGLALIAVPIVNDLFTVAPAFEELTDGFRDTVMSEEAVAQARSDVAALGAVAEEFETAVVPTLAATLQMEPATFIAFIGEQYTAVATGVAALPDVAAQFTQVLDLIESQQQNFADADAIPTESLPVTTVPWGIVLVGVAAVAVAVVMMVKGRLGAILAIVLGAAVVIGTFALSFISKSEAADDLNEAFLPFYTGELVTQSEGALIVVGAMGQEMQTAMLPGLGEQLGMSTDEVQVFIGENFPATGGALAALPEAMGRFETMVGAFDAQLDNYNTIKETALTPIAWTVLIGGAVVLILGIWALTARTQAAGAESTDTPPKEAGAQA